MLATVSRPLIVVTKQCVNRLLLDVICKRLQALAHNRRSRQWVWVHTARPISRTAVHLASQRPHLAAAATSPPFLGDMTGLNLVRWPARQGSIRAALSVGSSLPQPQRYMKWSQTALFAPFNSTKRAARASRRLTEANARLPERKADRGLKRTPWPMRSFAACTMMLLNG